MKCENEKCGKEHDGSFGSGKFCNRQCANSRKHSDATKQKQSESVLRYRSEHPIECSRTKEQIEETINIFKKTCNDRLLNADFSTLKYGVLKKRVVLEQSGKCNNCGLLEWLGKPINLEIEHKDGNHYNNVRENVEAICPNCHSFTKTWRGRNKSQNLRPFLTYS